MNILRRFMNNVGFECSRHAVWAFESKYFYRDYQYLIECETTRNSFERWIFMVKICRDWSIVGDGDIQFCTPPSKNIVITTRTLTYKTIFSWKTEKYTTKKISSVQSRRLIKSVGFYNFFSNASYFMCLELFLTKKIVWWNWNRFRYATTGTIARAFI